LRIVIDINDELVTDMGAIYLHNPSYDAAKVVALFPGFKFTVPTVSAAVRVSVLPKEEVKPKEPEQKGDNKPDTTEPTSLATPADDDKDNEIKEPEKDNDKKDGDKSS